MSHKETILFSVKTVDNLAKKVLERQAAASGQELTIMHAWIIGFLYNAKEPVYQRDVEREFKINRATVSGMLTLMEQKGLIRRSSVSHDGRLKRIELTEHGRRQHEERVEHFLRLERTLEEALSPEELSAFFAMTDRLRKTLESLVQNEKGGELSSNETND